MERAKRQGASIRLVKALSEIGYIGDRWKEDLLYRLQTGDDTAYSEVRELLLEIAEEINKI